MAQKLKVTNVGIKKAYRLQGKNGQHGNIQVQLEEENVRNEWLKATKSTAFTMADVQPEDISNSGLVYVRKNMT